MRGFRVGVLTAVLAGAGLCAPSAQAAQFQFVGNHGTVCTVEAAAEGTVGIGALALPGVGFSGVPVCAYARSAAGSRVGGASAGGSAKRLKRSACKRKHRKGKRAHVRACKHRKRRGGAMRSAIVTRAAATSGVATLDHAELELLGPTGLTMFGVRTLTSLPFGGYSCVLAAGADCSDQASLSPAIPGLSYRAQYSVELTPPAGETWIGLPPGCSGSPAQCVLDSESVTPTL